MGAADADDGGVVDYPHLGPVDAGEARRITLEMAAILLRMTRDRYDSIQLCRSVSEIEAAEAAGAIAAILHLEGAEAIGPI